MSEILNPKVDIVRLANTFVLTEEDKKLKVGRLWQKKPIIFIFLRHFACIACRAHAKQVWDSKEKYEATGGSIIFIGNGSPEYIKSFREDLNLEDAIILTDPSLESFRAAGFHRGFFYVVQFSSAMNAVKLATKGYKQTSYKKEAGTHWQLGGVLVIKPSGAIAYHYISEYLGDFPSEPSFDKITEDEKNKETINNSILY